MTGLCSAPGRLVMVTKVSSAGGHRSCDSCPLHPMPCRPKHSTSLNYRQMHKSVSGPLSLVVSQHGMPCPACRSRKSPPMPCCDSLKKPDFLVRGQLYTQGIVVVRKFAHRLCFFWGGSRHRLAGKRLYQMVLKKNLAMKDHRLSDATPPPTPRPLCTDQQRFAVSLDNVLRPKRTV